MRDGILVGTRTEQQSAEQKAATAGRHHLWWSRPIITATLAGMLATSMSPIVEAQPAPSARSIEKSMAAVHAAGPITVDGVLDDPSWAQAEPITDFVQQEPNVNQPATQRTEVRVLLGDDALYFGVRCLQSPGDSIMARERRRDNPLIDEDRFEIVLDTFHDHRNGYHFVINPLGTQYDALVTDEGRDVNIEWDERWWSETRITEEGWTAEIKIPFTTLRSDEHIDTYGINFLRFSRRTNERALWTAWDRDFQFLQVSQAGHLTGVGGIRTGLKLRIKPYALGGVRADVTTGNARDGIHDLGLEVIKFSVTPALTAEITVNTDFAQTEVDEAVVNLTRFPLFFPEKREFFLERAGIFEFGIGGRRGGQAERNLQMFFSRRIGLTEDRRPVPIIGGAKVVGHAAGLDLGVLSVQTDRFEETPGSNYTVVRAKRNVLARSNVGFFLSNRQALRLGGARSGQAREIDFNRVAGADATFTLFKNTDFQGFVARSWTPGRHGNAYAGRAKYNWFTDRSELFFEHLWVGPDFQHDVGFVRRHDIQRSNAAAIWQPRPPIPGLRFFVFRGELVYLTDIRRVLLGREQILQTTARWQSDDAVRFNTTATLDRLDRPFEIARGIVVPPGDYNFRDNFVEGEGGGKRLLSGRVRYGGGDFYGGTRQYVQLRPVFRPSDILSLEASYELNDVTLPQGAFTTHVVNARANLTVSNRWLTTALVQYDSASRRHVVFARLNYIYRPGDDVFVVVNRATDRGTGRPAEYAVMVKVTYSVDF